MNDRKKTMKKRTKKLSKRNHNKLLFLFFTPKNTTFTIYKQKDNKQDII